MEFILINKGYVDTLIHKGKTKTKYVDEALAIEPNNTIALYNKGVALDDLGDYTQAIQYYDKVLAIDANHTSALNNKGVALLTV